MSLILGLDLGANSIGWALCDDKEHKIVDCGVRIFEEGVNNMNQKREESKNSTRRLHRQIRKRLRRLRGRKYASKKFLQNLGLMPEENTLEFFSMNPYDLRAKAAAQRLSEFELGRALYHLNKRRGYKSNRKETTDEKEKGAIYEGTKEGKPGISELRREMENGGHKTIGQYLASLDPHEKRIRNRFTERSMYEEEFEIIWEKQREYYPNILTDEKKREFKEKIMFFQRPLQSQKSKVGRCALEPGKRRCQKSRPVAQEFRILQQLNSLRIMGGNRMMEENQELTSKERQILIEALSSTKQLTFKSIGTKLKLDKRVDYKFNLESLGKLKGMSTLIDIRKALGKSYNDFTEEEIDDIWHILSYAEDNDWLFDHLKTKYDLEDDKAESLTKITLEKGYANLSYKAMKNMLPYMREGYMYHEAAEKAGYDHALMSDNPEIVDYLPEPPNIRNPIVSTALWQLRGVVNSIVDTYGKPDEISIELGRDLKNPLDRRVEIQNNNKKIEAENDRIREILREDLQIDPSRNDLIKFKLWEECDKTCPFTGNPISFDQLYRTGEVDIEHILPFSRTLDNSYMNLTLCFREENERKGNKIPYEMYSSDEAKYEGIIERIKNFPQSKARRFIQKEIDLDDFISRQLNDSRYISREAMKYMKHIVEKVRVTPGNMTSELRHLWGLNSVLPIIYKPGKSKDAVGKDDIKNREDHRHHAVDAIVVAFTKRGYLQRASTQRARYGFGRENVNKEDFPAPWEFFRSDVAEAVSNIIISRKIKRNPRGTLHKETNYGALKNVLGEPLISESGLKTYVVRKPIESLTPKELGNIVDPVVKDTLIERLEELGVDTSKKKFKIPNNAFAEPVYLVGSKTGKKTQIKKVRFKKDSGSMVQVRDYNIFVEPRSNHHIVIFSEEDGSIGFDVVTLYEASRRKKKGLPLIDKSLRPGQEFITALQRNDLLLIGEAPEKFDVNDKFSYRFAFNQIYRVQKFDQNGVIVLRQHFVTFTDNTDNRGVIRKNPGTLVDLGCRKLRISHHGFLEFSDD